MELAVRDAYSRQRFVHRPCGHCFGTRLCPGQAAAAVGPGCGGARRQLGQAEAKDAKRRAGATSGRAREIVGGAARRGNDDPFGGWSASVELSCAIPPEL